MTVQNLGSLECEVTAEASNPITELLAAVRRAEEDAPGRLWAAIYDELRRVARNQLRGEAAGRTLQPTALVHETYLRLFGNSQVEWANRRQFFAAAAKVMRCIRIDDARKRKRVKHGGPGAGRDSHAGVGPSKDSRPSDWPSVRVGEWDEPAAFDQDPAEVLAVDEALKKLEEFDPRKAEVVTLRYFAGLTRDETAEVLGVSPRTVDSEWHFARAWLHRALSE